MFGKDLRHPLVPLERAAVEAYLGGRERGIVHEEWKTIAAEDEVLLQHVDGLLFDGIDVGAQLHELLGVGRGGEGLLGDGFIFLAESKMDRKIGARKSEYDEKEKETIKDYLLLITCSILLLTIPPFFI